MRAHCRELPSRFLLPRSGGLVDNHGRRITYLRLGITDRCNLRCQYCMPEEGVKFTPRSELLRFEELERLVRLLASLGITKVRITGGEPFVRRGCLEFMQRLRALGAIQSLHVTTNGVSVLEHLDGLAKLGIKGINLSLDTLDRDRFRQITRRDYLPQVLATLEGCRKRCLPLKINSVVLEDTPDEEIFALADLPRRYPLSLRFIELMPFSGAQGVRAGTARALRERLHGLFPYLVPLLPASPSTARLYALPGFAGTIGLIEGNSRRFCATCNKIRITPTGWLKTCLYDNGAVNLKVMLRGGADDEEISVALINAVSHRYRDGLEAEAYCGREHGPVMASIGG